MIDEPCVWEAVARIDRWTSQTERGAGFICATLEQSGISGSREGCRKAALHPYLQNWKRKILDPKQAEGVANAGHVPNSSLFCSTLHIVNEHSRAGLDCHSRISFWGCELDCHPFGAFPGPKPVVECCSMQGYNTAILGAQILR